MVCHVEPGNGMLALLVIDMQMVTGWLDRGYPGGCATVLALWLEVCMTMAPLPARRRAFSALWVILASSYVAIWALRLALPLFAAEQTAWPLLVALITFAFNAPWPGFSLIADALVDRLDRARLLQLAAAVQVLVLSVALGLGLAVTYGQLATREVEVLHPQAQALEQAQAAPVEQLGHEQMRTVRAEHAVERPTRGSSTAPVQAKAPTQGR